MRFETTYWSNVLAAREAEGSRRQRALGVLCESYWFPLYAYVRRRGYSPEEAQDLTQEFFARLIEKNYLKQVSAERGRFRTFLLTAMGNFLSNEWDRANAKKRGGGRTIISLDFLQAENRLAQEPSHNHTPEAEYQRKWAMALLDRVLQRLKAEMEKAGKGERFDFLKDYLVGDPDTVPYASLSARTGMKPGALKTAVHRIRARYGVLIREEIAHTVAKPEDVQEELRHLMEILAGKEPPL